MDKNISKLNPGTPSQFAGSAYLNEEVYIFGC